MDWVSRAVLAWRLSNTLGAEFCVEALEEALSRYGQPEIFNTDQGSQFTSDDFTGTRQGHAITISMDGKSLPRRRPGAAIGTISSSSGCGAASNTRRSSGANLTLGTRPFFSSSPRKRVPRAWPWPEQGAADSEPTAPGPPLAHRSRRGDEEEKTGIICLIQTTLMSAFSRCRQVNLWLCFKRSFWAIAGRAGDTAFETTVDHTLMRGSEPHDR